MKICNFNFNFFWAKRLNSIHKIVVIFGIGSFSEFVPAASALPVHPNVGVNPSQTESEITLKVAGIKKLSTSHFAKFTIQPKKIARLQRDPITQELLLRGLKVGDALLYTESLIGAGTQKIHVKVIAADKPKARLGQKQNSFLRRNYQVPGWD